MESASELRIRTCLIREGLCGEEKWEKRYERLQRVVYAALGVEVTALGILITVLGLVA